MRKFISKKCKRFASETDGNISVEFAIYLPLILFIFAMVVTFYDAFRQESINLKAAYTVSDLISRETQELNDDYIDSMQNMAELLVRPDSELSLRVTIARWDEEEAQYSVDWSRERGDAYVEMTDAELATYSDQLPNMPDQERIIIVQTYNLIEPVFPLVFLELRDADFSDSPENLREQSLFAVDTFVFTRPRFAPLVRFEGEIIAGPAHDDGTTESF